MLKTTRDIEVKIQPSPFNSEPGVVVTARVYLTTAQLVSRTEILGSKVDKVQLAKTKLVDQLVKALYGEVEEGLIEILSAVIHISKRGELGTWEEHQLSLLQKKVLALKGLVEEART